MQKDIAHVFPTYTALLHHLQREFVEGQAVVVNRGNNTYDNMDGSKHWCFPIRERDDIHRFLAYTFFEHHIHGDFHHLPPDDFEFLKGMLRQRTRYVPEVA